MIWILTIPFIMYFTFADVIGSGFPGDEPHHRSFLEWAFCLFVCCFLSFLISLVPIAIAAFIGGLPRKEGRKSADYQLIALREKDGSKGRSYFLGAGFVNDVQYYFWYRKNKDGSISGGKTTREPGVRIRYTKEPPFMRVYKSEYVSALAQRYLWIVGLGAGDDENFSPDFFIPEGSIKEGFSL